MRNRFLSLIYILCLGAVATMAQPSPVKKAAKSIFKVTTFKADGSLLSTGYGAFTDANGTAIAAWTPFAGAASAVIIDGQGKKYDVESIYGANSIYNVAKIKVKVVGKSSIVPLVLEQGQQNQGNEIWCVGYDVKSPQFTKLTATKVETFMGDMPYYVIEQPECNIDDRHIGSPFINAQGQLMGLTNTSAKRTDLYVASARYAMTLAPSAFSVNDNTLRNTSIRIALPTEYNQAMLAMMIAAQRNDSINYPATLEEFITMFPDKEDGYTYKASYLTDRLDFNGADAAMAKALEVSAQKDNTHFFYSKIIYNKELLLNNVPYEGWSFDKALAEIDEALLINPLPLYSVHKGKILLAQQKHADALNVFLEVNKSSYQDAECYFNAYKCMKALEQEQEKQMEMLDSAIVLNDMEMGYKAEKALLLMKMGKAPETIALCQQMINIAPRYAEGHGILGVALCLCGRKEIGVAELRRAKALGYAQADELIEKYGKKE